METVVVNGVKAKVALEAGAVTPAVEKIIEAVKKARPTATSPVLENPLWSDRA